jgi:hypothetical protein
MTQIVCDIGLGIHYEETLENLTRVSVNFATFL